MRLSTVALCFLAYLGRKPDSINLATTNKQVQSHDDSVQRVNPRLTRRDSRESDGGTSGNASRLTASLAYRPLMRVVSV